MKISSTAHILQDHFWKINHINILFWTLFVRDQIVVIRIKFQYKGNLIRYGYPHYKDKMVMKLSYLYDGNIITSKISLH